MELNKIAQYQAKNEPYLKPISDLGIGFYNLDENTATLQFRIYNENGPLLISDENVDVHGYFESSNGSVSSVLDLNVVDGMNGIAQITLDKDFLQASTSTQVKGQIYVAVNNATDNPENNQIAVLGEFTFQVADALINKVSSFTKVEYIRMFDKLREEIKQRTLEMEENIGNIESLVQEVSDAVDAGKKEITKISNDAISQLNDIAQQSDKEIKQYVNQALTDISSIVDKYETKLTDDTQDKIDEVNAASEEVLESIKNNSSKFKGPKGDKGDKGDVGPAGTIEKLHLYNKLNGTFSDYEIPKDLDVKVPFNVQTNKNGEVKVDYDVSKQKNPVKKTYYVDIKTGANNNSGTKSEPFESIHRAFRYGDADEIIVNEGVYGWSDAFNSYAQSKPYNLIGKGTVIVGAHRDKLTWEKNETYSNVYQTNTTSVIELIDYKEVENIRVMSKKSSIKEVSENKNAYYIDSNNTLYVRTYDDREPDDRILPNLTTDAAKIVDNPKIYFENLIFSNTVRLTATSTNKQFYAKDCYFSVGTIGNALSVEGYDYNILQNCKASHAMRDGFNYHAKNDIAPKAIEIDCVGFNNGRDGADRNNGSTVHGGSHILRVNGEHFNNGGPNVIDVNEGTVSVNIGVHSHHSRATKNTVSNSNFKNGNVGSSKMYLVNCLSNGSDYSVVTATSQGSETVIENSLLMENQDTV